MSKDDLASHIRNCWIYAQALGVGELFSGPSALIASDSFKSLANNPDACYEELYLAGMREGQYNILLVDYSFFQFGSCGRDGVRFAYYPNPFLGAASEALGELQEMRDYVSEGIIDMDEFLHKVAEIRHSQHPPLVRYEYSKHQYVEATHPCSHLHIGFHGENRWPVRRYLTASAFSLFIFRLFYLNFWMQAETIKHGERLLNMDEIFAQARMGSRMLYEDEFSAAEAQRLHFM